IDHADRVLDFGPGAGVDGGRIVASAEPGRLRRTGNSLTGKYLSGKEAIAVPTNRRPVKRAGAGERSDLDAEESEQRCEGRWLTVFGARHHNLKNVDVELPLGRFIVVTGVSGSGKSSLVTEILYPALAHRIHRARLTPGAHESIRGIELVDKVINVDQQAIGSSPASNPATYTGVFDLIRELYSRLPDSRVRGYSPERFSFNRPGGRCEACNGNGEVCIEMHFLPDVWVTCEECDGRRYNNETLGVRYRDKSIADVLSMRVSEALKHFEAVPKVRRMLQTLADVGLDYVQLGQSAPTLSGGEAQRVKLASELGRPTTGKTIYILDEPTTGLHFHDLRKLLGVLNRLVDAGNTVICIEHNLDVIKTADWVIDLGPEAGDGGGEVVAAGAPESVAACPESHTGRMLAEVLSAGPYAERPVFDAKAQAAAELDGERLVPNDIGDAVMPWQRDGRAWHTRDRVDRQGRAIRWEGEALEFVVDQIVDLGGDRLAGADWNHQARVEITSPRSKVPWFFHALTGGEWLLDLTFRAPRGRFRQEQLEDMLGLKTLDERTDLPIYGQWSRVTIRRAMAGLDRIRVMVHDKAEIDTAGFRRFLRQAVLAYSEYSSELQEDPSKAEPWKTDGKQWHLQQRRMTRRQGIAWQGTTLLQVIGAMQKAVPGLEVEWNHKIAVVMSHKDVTGWWCRIVTAFAEHIQLEFRSRPNQFTPAMVDRIGPWNEIKRSGRLGGDEVRFRFEDMKQIDARALSTFLKAYHLGVCQAFRSEGGRRS
ncbi:MAG: excinuclease ABC subunit A, partial [Phycisphaerae bacterium]|nr:excinuclease ABC subunit A [Phycisphaerae bacterium]